MCNILDKYPEDTFTGYKVAYKKDGKYYSITSHIEYKPGPVKGVKNVTALNGIENSTDTQNHFFLKQYFGRTSVFRNCYDFTNFFNNVEKRNPDINIVWLKMTISGDLKYGSVDKRVDEDSIVVFKECVSGTNIDSIEEWGL